MNEADCINKKKWGKDLIARSQNWRTLFKVSYQFVHIFFLPFPLFVLLWLIYIYIYMNMKKGLRWSWCLSLDWLFPAVSWLSMLGFCCSPYIFFFLENNYIVMLLFRLLFLSCKQRNTWSVLHNTNSGVQCIEL